MPHMPSESPLPCPPPAPPSHRFAPAEFWLLASVTLLLAGLDQYSKGAAVERLGPLQRNRTGHLHLPRGMRPVTVIPGALRITLSGNEGAIFGVGQRWSPRIKTPLFYGLSGLAVLFVLLLLRHSQPGQRWLRLGLASVLSGALGNGLDRIRLGYVVDFIDWHGGFRWPTFNVADIAITVGCGVVLIALWRAPPEPCNSAVPPPPTGPEETTSAGPSSGSRSSGPFGDSLQ